MKKILLVLGFAAVGGIVPNMFGSMSDDAPKTIEEYRQQEFEKIRKAYGKYDSEFGGEFISDGLRASYWGLDPDSIMPDEKYLLYQQSSEIKDYFKAVLDGNVEAVRQLLNSKKIEPNQKIYTVMPVTDKVQQDQLVQAKRQVYMDMNVSRITVDGQQAAAAVFDAVHEAKYREEMQRCEWISPLWLAVVLVRSEIVALLLKAGADVNGSVYYCYNSSADEELIASYAFVSYINAQSFAQVEYEHICKSLFSAAKFDVSLFTQYFKKHEGFCNISANWTAYQNAISAYLKSHPNEDAATMSESVTYNLFVQAMKPYTVVINLLASKGFDLYKVFTIMMRDSFEEFKKFKEQFSDSQIFKQASAEGSAKKVKVRKSSIAVAA